MRPEEYFGMKPEPSESESERAMLLEQVEMLLDKAVKLQGELAHTITYRHRNSSMEDSKRLANQQEILERCLKTDRQSQSSQELQKMTDDLLRVINNLESHKESYLRRRDI